MMSDYAINLLKAIESGEQGAMDDAFKAAIGAKITDALDAKKIEIAKDIYGGSSDEQVSDDEVETETSEEHGTEEV